MQHGQSMTALNVDSIEKFQSVTSPLVFHHEFQRLNKPVILTDAFSDSVPVSADKLVSFVGDMQVSVRVYGAERFRRQKLSG